MVRNPQNGKTVVEERNFVETSWTPTTPFADGPFAWRVSALTPADTRGDWTDQMNIKIGGQTTVLTPVGSTGSGTNCPEGFQSADECTKGTLSAGTKTVWNRE